KELKPAALLQPIQKRKQFKDFCPHLKDIKSSYFISFASAELVGSFRFRNSALNSTVFANSMEQELAALRGGEDAYIEEPLDDLVMDEREIQLLPQSDSNRTAGAGTDTEIELNDEDKIRGWVRLDDDNMHQLKPADVLEIRYNGMPHTILIERVTTTADKTVATAFHYGWHRAVKTVVREEFLLSGRRYCRLLLFSKSCCYPSEVVLQRAESRLNDRNYDRMQSNSGQFARW
uniref:Agenet-like domain-containing protein n=1 Tax=Macrostomum lignano TaxID=282301 RepID=A0A1I8J5N1_9PLAT